LHEVDWSIDRLQARGDLSLSLLSSTRLRRRIVYETADCDPATMLLPLLMQVAQLLEKEAYLLPRKLSFVYSVIWHFETNGVESRLTGSWNSAKLYVTGPE
jgi:hypothetical protein